MICYLPDLLARRIEDIPPSFFLSRSIRHVLCDLDNTLAPVDIAVPNEDIKRWCRKMEASGIAIYIASNNSSRRVRRFAEGLGVHWVGSLCKPFSFRLVRFCKNKGIGPEAVAFVGDQLFTDVPAAKKAGFLTILTEPISEKDSILTYFNRKREKKARQEINERRLVPSWEEKQ